MNEEIEIKAVLLAARDGGPQIFRMMAKRRPTFCDMERALQREKITLIVLAVIGFPIFYLMWPVLLLYWIFLFKPKVLLLKSARVLFANGSAAASPDAECSHLALRGDIERIVRGMSKDTSMFQQLEQTTCQWRYIQTKLADIEGKTLDSSESELLSKQHSLKQQLAQETDSVSSSSLQTQLQAVEGQIKANSTMQTWYKRMKNAQEESTEGLKQLRANLLLQSMGGNLQDTISEAYTALQRLNTGLASVQQAEEEIMKIGNA